MPAHVDAFLANEAENQARHDHDKALERLEREVADLAFMYREGYITNGRRGDLNTAGQLAATIRHALEALKTLKEASTRF